MSHVKSIKNRFERLNTEELSDIVPLRMKHDSQSSSFQRSVTLFEFNSPSSKKKEEEESPKASNFQRQDSNNSNSSYKSLRRSQAFRLDGQLKPNLTTKSSPSKLKRQNAVKYTSPSTKHTQFDEIQYLATSETIKKALQKPLPKGPAPLKPPRTFLSSPKTSPCEENVNLVGDIERATNVTNRQNFSISKGNELERRTTTLPKTTEKREDYNKKGISSFLNCIISPCSIDPIYYEQIRQERRKQFETDEKIYMEPFEHLNYMKDLQGSDAGGSSPKTEELHYLCTNIIDQTSSNQPLSQNDINRNFQDSSVESSDFESYEKINILMDVVYDEKHRDNIIEENSGGSEVEFKVAPISKVSRSLTEKRKNYVRRVTETALNHQPSSATSIISQFQRIIDSNTTDGATSAVKKSEGPNLFKMLILVGFDMMNSKGYVKSIYPKSEKAPPMIEQFIYPSSKCATDYMTKENQNFSLILTDECGNNMFGYCRQICAEGFDEKCLPLTYCIITKECNASGFYFSLLEEIESRHGYPEVQFSNMMRCLQNKELPKNGKVLQVKIIDKKLPAIAKKPDRETLQQKSPPNRLISKRLSLESPEWLKTPEASVLLNNSNKSNETISISRSNTDTVTKRSDEIIIKRASDVRLQNHELTVLYESTTKELLIAIFGTLLIERKVILLGRNISQITSCMTALYSILYPFQWHHIIIALVPDQTIELLQAPFPFFAGVLKTSVNINTLEIEDGIVVDLDTKTLVRKCGDEATLVPETLKKSLLLSLKIVEAIDKGEKLKNVLIAEAFLQYFIKLFAKFEARDYCKSKFIESHDDQAITFFLEWFLDTIMFKEFLSRKLNDEKRRESGQSSEDYFELFNIKVLEKSATLSDNQQRRNVEMLMKSSKQKRRNFKDKIKDFLKS